MGSAGEAEPPDQESEQDPQDPRTEAGPLEGNSTSHALQAPKLNHQTPTVLRTITLSPTVKQALPEC